MGFGRCPLGLWPVSQAHLRQGQQRQDMRVGVVTNLLGDVQPFGQYVERGV